MFPARAISIKQKLRLMILFTSSMAVLLASLIFLFFAVRWFDAGTEHELVTLAALAGYSAQAPLDFNSAEQAESVIKNLRAAPNIIVGCVYLTNGTIFAQYVRKDVLFQPPTTAPADGYQPRTLEIVTPVFSEDGSRAGTVYLRSDMAVKNAFLEHCVAVLLASIFVALLAAVFLAGKFQKAITEPLLRLLGTTKNVSAEKNYSVRATRSASDEIGDLVNGFNEMLDQIQLRDQELRKYHDELEEQVARRTSDLTDTYRNLVQSYDRLKKLESLKDNLTHMIVHDLRSPLMAMMQNTGVLKMMLAGKLDQEEIDYLNQISQTCADQAEMINSLLDIGRMEAGEMPLNLSPCDMRIVADLALDHLRPLIGPRLFSRHYPEAPAPICCDSDLIRRVIANLAGNALKYTPENGSVELKIELQSNYIKFSVRDTGLGIPREFHERIFQKFVQVENRKLRNSSGLGLAFCKLAVEAHEGQIGVESEINKGSTFWFTLPARGPSHRAEIS